MAVAPVGAGDPARQPLAGDLGDRGRSEVEDDCVGGRQLLQRAHPPAGLDPAAVLGDRRRQRVGDRARATPRDRPSVVVAGADQGHPDRGAERRGERPEGVGGGAGEERPRLGARQGTGQRRGRRRGAQAEAGEQQRMARQAVGHRPEDVLGEPVEGRRGGAEEPLPGLPRIAQAGRRLLDRAQHRRHLAAVERMGEIDLRPGPLEPVAVEAERRQRRRADGKGVDGRAVVVEQARQGQLAGAGTAADRLGRLDHRHPHPAARQDRGAGQPVGAGPDDHRLAHAGRAGKGLPSSQGWRPTMSATSTVPSSTRPSAAS